MNKDIENKFFEAFKQGGFVDDCIAWMRKSYNLPHLKPRRIEKATTEVVDDFIQGDSIFYIHEEVMEFDDGGVYGIDSPLMNEIEANLNECSTVVEKERYVFSMLKYFGDYGCGFSTVFYPMGEVKRLEKWSPTEGRKEQIEWVWYVHNRFIELLNNDIQEYSVAYHLRHFRSVEKVFADSLDALLLTKGIDLMRLQEESGLYIKAQREITDVDCFIGSLELAQKYIDSVTVQDNESSNQQAPEIEEKPAESPNHSKDVILLDGKQENADQQPKKKGKPVKSFKDKMVDDVDGKKLQKIHSVMSGKTGKDAVLIVYACFNNGWVVSKPSYTAVKDEFGEVVCKSQYDGYWKGAKDIFTEQEIDGVKKNLTIEESEK